MESVFEIATVCGCSVRGTLSAGLDENIVRSEQCDEDDTIVDESK